MAVTILFLILPTMLAGLTFIYILKTKRLSILNFPIDFGITFRGKRLFGEHKTLKGLITMAVCTSMYGSVIYVLFSDVLPLHLDPFQVMMRMFCIGLAYSVGELPNSFMKRQMSVPPGKQHHNKAVRFIWQFIDTYDSLVVIAVCYIVLFEIQFLPIVIAVVIGGILHLITDYIMVVSGLKKCTIPQ